jgi:hypothetical protein
LPRFVPVSERTLRPDELSARRDSHPSLLSLQGSWWPRVHGGFPDRIANRRATCTQAQDPRLRQLLMANQDRISFRPEDIDRSVNDVSVPGFVELADVPDKVWKFPKSQETK